MSFLRALLLFFSLATCCVGVFAGFEDRRFEKDRIELVESLNSILVTNGECQSIADCQKKQIIFACPMSGGVAVQIWGARKKEAARQILEKLSTAFLDQVHIQNIVVDFYDMSKEDSLRLPIWKSAKPSIKITLRREK